MRYAIFDFDGTIIRGNAGLRWTLIMLSRFSLKSLFFGVLYPLKLCSYPRWIASAIKDLGNESAKMQIRYYEGKIKKSGGTEKLRYNRKTVEELIKLYHKGYKIAVITQSMDFVVKKYVQKMEAKFKVKIDKLYCTKTEIKNDRFAKVIPVVGREKQNYFKSADLAESYFFTDSLRDRTLLRKVKFPVAVNPNPLFWLIAKINGWKIIS